MRTLKIKAVDSVTGLLTEREVDENRYRAIDAAMRQIMIGDDQDSLAFSVAQLAYTEAEVFERKYTPMQGEELVPQTSVAGPAATSVEYQIIEKAGQAADLSPSAQDVPMVDIGMARQPIAVSHGGIGYQYTQQDLRTAVMLKRPIDGLRMEAALEAYRREVSQIALFGKPAKGLYGLFNLPNSLVTPNTTNSVHFDAVSSDDVVDTVSAALLAMINSDMAAAWAATNFNTIPNTMVLPPTAFTVCLNRYRNSASDKTLLDIIAANNLYTKQTGKALKIVPGYGLDDVNAAAVGSLTVNATGTTNSRMIYYNNDTQNMLMHVPMPLQFLAPQLRGVWVTVNGEYRYAGLILRRPKTVYYRDHVLAAG